MEQRVTERTRQLQASNKELEAFSYSVSHDLRAPLRAIDGFSQLLLKKYIDQLDEPGNNYLQRIRNASERMGGLIDDLLQLSKVSACKIKTKPVDLSQLVHSILTELQETETNRQVEFNIQDGVFIDADPRLFRIVLENLISNAWKFTGRKERTIICFGIKEGSCVIANKPTLNFLPSLAIVENMVGPFSKTSFPKTRGASSNTIEIFGLSLSVPCILYDLYFL